MPQEDHAWLFFVQCFLIPAVDAWEVEQDEDVGSQLI